MTNRRPGRFLRLLFRIPVFLYRIGLGGYERLFGQRWILVTTRGRRTGARRRVMLDLLDQDAATGRCYVQPGWGRNAAWVTNIEADPLVEVQLGRRRFPARAVEVSGEEGAERLLRFVKKHPLQSRLVARWMLGIEPPRDEEGLRAFLVANAIVYAFEPRATAGPG